MSEAPASALPSPRGFSRKKAALVAIKAAVTLGCLWYVARQVEFAKITAVAGTLDIGWLGLAELVVMLQIPLVALRWNEILAALAARRQRITAMIAVTAIGQFFTQVLPNVVGDGMRAWLLARLGSGWRNAVTSVVIDRGVGVGLMIALACGILLLPSALTALAGYRDAVLAVYGAMLMAGLIGLLLVPLLVPILERWRYTREIGTFAAAARRVLIGPRSPAILAIACLVHALTILIVWSLGRAQGLALPVADAAVLFTVMVGISIIPVSVGGWGLRELAVVSVLGDHGIAPERALLFSVCFGLVFVVGSLPGALAWLLYPLPPPERSPGAGR
jgi:glycosyltransferase 2 family protein